MMVCGKINFLMVPVLENKVEKLTAVEEKKNVEIFYVM